MLLTHYYALATGAVLLTAAWLFRPDARVKVTTLGAFLAWSLVALLGDQTETFDHAVEAIETGPNGTELAVQQPGQLVATPVPDELRFFAAMWALLSVLALLLAAWGVYPPSDDNPTEQP
jgi:hypothetical protein